jgi:hypothetical protein
MNASGLIHRSGGVCGVVAAHPVLTYEPVRCGPVLAPPCIHHLLGGSGGSSTSSTLPDLSQALLDGVARGAADLGFPRDRALGRQLGDGLGIQQR